MYGDLGYLQALVCSIAIYWNSGDWCAVNDKPNAIERTLQRNVCGGCPAADCG